MGIEIFGLDIYDYFALAVMGLFFGLQFLSRLLPRPEDKKFSWRKLWKK